MQLQNLLKRPTNNLTKSEPLIQAHSQKQLKSTSSFLGRAGRTTFFVHTSGPPNGDAIGRCHRSDKLGTSDSSQDGSLTDAVFLCLALASWCLGYCPKRQTPTCNVPFSLGRLFPAMKAEPPCMQFLYCGFLGQKQLRPVAFWG